MSVCVVGLWVYGMEKLTIWSGRSYAILLTVSRCTSDLAEFQVVM